MKTTLKLIIGLLVVVALSVMVANSIVRKTVRKAVLNTTGFDIEIGRLHIGFFEPVVEVSAAQLINPEDFPEPTALEIKTLRIVYELKSLWSQEVRFREIFVDIPRAVLLIREDGESNLLRLGGKVVERQEGKSREAKSDAPEEPKTESSRRKLRVDALTLKLDRVEMRRYREGAERPEVKEYGVALNRTARDVTDLSTVNAMITAGLIEGIGSEALRLLGRELGAPERIAPKTSDGLEKVADKLSDQLQKMLGSTVEGAAAQD